MGTGIGVNANVFIKLMFFHKEAAFWELIFKNWQPGWIRSTKCHHGVFMCTTYMHLGFNVFLAFYWFYVDTEISSNCSVCVRTKLKS